MFLRLFRSPFPFFGWFLLMNVLLLMPDQKLETKALIEIPHLDKAIHFTIYCLLVFLGTMYLKLKGREGYKWLLLIIAMAHGLQIEFLQKIPSVNRDFSWFDFLFDCLGAATGFISAHYYFKKFPELNRVK
ncbi:VanZ family protein [Flavihumibacter sp.]|uniref:VanZ family protein n=1 Tax=Flavihumibacter sp. TaxID=1913981 RepID=UPI002FC7FB67|nr:VanZ family protein [Flavihumibacter sediminis]